MNLDLFTSIRILIPALGLLYASYRDWVEREVDDWVWAFCGAAGGALTAISLISSWSLSLSLITAFSMGLSIGLAFTLYFFGLYGGADAKAVAVISLSLPIYHPPVRLHPFTGLASLSNGLLLSLILLLGFLLRNLIALARGEKIFEGFEHEKTARKIAAMLLGTRVRNARRKKFWFPLEAERDGKRVFDFKLFELEFEEITRDDCWATPGIPLLIFITAGFLIFIAAGDLLKFILDAIFPGTL